MTTPDTVGQSSGTVDFNLHGKVGVRLVRATPRDVATVGRQLGPIRSPLNGEPDIVIEFVDRLPRTSPLYLLGLDDAAFTDEAFLVLRGRRKSRVMVQIPFHEIGRGLRIVCESGLPAIPLMMPILNLTALGNGVLPLHATAFNFNGTGVLVTGWSKGGKTETLLAFAAKGAEYVGDEWIYLSEDGQQMYGVPEPVRVWNWQLQQLPSRKAVVERGTRARLRCLGLLTAALDKLASFGGKRTGVIRRINFILKNQLSVRIPPERLFGRTVGSLASTPRKIFFIGSYDSPRVVVRPMEPQEIARKMAFSLQEERTELMSYYYRFRFAFPDAANPLIDRAEELERAMLGKAVAGKEAFAVFHPYPVSIPALFDAISPYCA